MLDELGAEGLGEHVRSPRERGVDVAALDLETDSTLPGAWACSCGAPGTVAPLGCHRSRTSYSTSISAAAARAAARLSAATSARTSPT